MKNKLYKVSVPVTVWVEIYTREESKEDAIELVEDDEELLELEIEFVKSHNRQREIIVKGYDFDKMQVEPVEDLAI
jgi:hypothetical protein